ncbi:circularly permuted type 2 ATP-grasp protein [Amphibiibacter pelophylacis]|uniref:Circularly permuted type 2 ATP-grasp protein n=1 Tax=Amphibiibacter pelophylacis TaxID=1799477 RepID=A0ACC6P1E3_9BURK
MNAPDTPPLPPSLRHDEMRSPDGSVRSAWQGLARQIQRTPLEAMSERIAQIERRIQEDGITHNAHGGVDRPWPLDLIPLIVSAQDWAPLAAGLAQRARLLNALLADLHGAQDSLRSGLLPPALVYGQHGFLWPCHGLQPPRGLWLLQLAVDVARAPDGRWWVLADRTQSPAGMGYALENRLIISRAFPDLFARLRVHHLADFFRQQRDSLAALAPTEAGETPHIALLTTGPAQATYFEQVFLARYLGLPLVEGQDLTVRSGQVLLRTLSGLKRVHVLLRWPDDALCDPLELRGDAFAGVAGLLQAVRAGQVLVANALGSGVVGCNALSGFLPGLCQHLLGEALLLPGVATWWCGEAATLATVRERVLEPDPDRADVLVKPAYPSQKMPAVFVSDLSASERQALWARITAQPRAYVVQESVRLSQAPVWPRQRPTQGDALAALQPRPLILRGYVTVTPEGRYTAMPGGLARVAADLSTRDVSLQRGGASKDVWVLSSGSVSDFTLLAPSVGVRDLVRSGANLSSRATENLFWLGRHSARVEHSARLLRVAINRLVDQGLASPPLAPVLALARALGYLPPARSGETEGDEGREEGRDEARDEAPADRFGLLQAIHDPRQGGSLASHILGMSGSASQVRERLSTDHWHTLGQLQREQRRTHSHPPALDEAIGVLDRVLTLASSLTGFALDNMTRDIGWHFLAVGRRMERLVFYSGAIAHRLVQPPDTAGLDWLLDLADSGITYRSRYPRTPELLPVIDLIVFDPHNPHSVLFQGLALQDDLGWLERTLPGDAAGFTAVLHGPLAALQAFDLTALEPGDSERLAQGAQDLAQALHALTAAAVQVADVLGRRCFTHADDVSQQTLAL